MINIQQKQKFFSDGFVIIRDLFDKEEIAVLERALQRDKKLAGSATKLDDGNGGLTRFGLWYDLNDDIYSLFIRDKRIIETMRELLDGDCYHYHSKIMYKDPNGGGAWNWHQDYGYWYHYGFLFPLMASCMIAIDEATEKNGCLQFLKGSHQMGRIEHSLLGQQISADTERVVAASRQFEKKSVTLEPGSAVFFHCNLLHGSGQNCSSHSRRCLITSYNSLRNLPYSGYDKDKPMFQGKQPSSTLPPTPSPDNAIKKYGRNVCTI